jgi:HAD superfamily hydrolase (TIGR01509 family)
MAHLKDFPFSAVIFDLDGTLIDSEKNYEISDSKILAEFGITYTKELRAHLIGRGIDEFVRTLIEDYGITENSAALLALKDERYLAVARTNTRVFPEMLKLLDYLRERKIPLGVASGSSLRVVKEMLSICEIAGYFDAVTSSMELKRGKPAPDVFLEAARRLGVPPAECLALEDSSSGVAAALAANMKVAAIPTLTNPPLDPVMEKATVLFPGGIETFTAEELLKRIGAKD